jgi:hypothetical protein
MTVSITQNARELLCRECSAFETLDVHEFAGDIDAYDDILQLRLAKEFTAKFHHAKAELIKDFGQASKTGEGGDETVPLSGVCHFAVWKQGSRNLFLAVTHEDRECPHLLILGVDEGE